MRRDVLRNRICWALAGSHLFAIFYSAIVIWKRFSFTEALDVIMIVTPLTGAYMTTIVQYFVAQHAAEPDLTLINKSAADLFTVLTAAFCIALVGVLIATGLGEIPPDLLKRSVAVIETVLGVYISLFIKVLFDAGRPGAQPVAAPAE